MNVPQFTTVHYPESDGRPMGETDDHRQAMTRIIELLQRHFANQQVYVSGDLLLYYEQGNPKKFVVPDAFIVKGKSPINRRTYRLWVEQVAPQLVIETTSKSTKLKDLKTKPEIYAHIGVHEYFLYDPTLDYLDPPLQGQRWVDGHYLAIPQESTGGLYSEELGMELRLENSQLQFFHRGTQDRLLTEAEAHQMAQTEIERLRAELAELRQEKSANTNTQGP